MVVSALNGNYRFLVLQFFGRAWNSVLHEIFCIDRATWTNAAKIPLSPSSNLFATKLRQTGALPGNWAKVTPFYSTWRARMELDILWKDYLWRRMYDNTHTETYCDVMTANPILCVQVCLRRCHFNQSAVQMRSAVSLFLGHFPIWIVW